MNLRLVLMTFVPLAGMLLMVGCGEAGPKLCDIKGNVSLDGSPMAEGEVLLSAEGSVVTQTLPISGGEFSGQIQPGTYRVQVFQYVEIAPTPDATGYVPPDPIRRNVIPPQWNTASTLTEVIPDSGKQDITLAITSK